MLRARMARQRMRLLLSGLGVVLVAGAVVGAMILGSSPAGGLNTSLHQHPHLAIFIKGSEVFVPADIGINASLYKDHSLDDFGEMSRQMNDGMSPMSTLHTHDSSGTIHVEMRVWHPCTLGDFFNVWGQPFDRDKLITLTGPVSVTVDGAANDQFRDLLLQDGQQIVIRAG